MYISIIYLKIAIDKIEVKLIFFFMSKCSKHQ